MLIVADIIEQARELHPSFMPSLQPDKTLRHYLSRWQREMVARLLIVRREAVSIELEVALPLADFDAGYTIVAEYQYLHGADVEYRDDPQSRCELYIVPWEMRHNPIPWPAVFIHGSVLKQLGAALDWNDATKIILRYAPTPTSLAAVTDTMVIPDNGENAAVAALGSFMATRKPNPQGQDPPDVGLMRENKREAEELLLFHEGSKNRATTGATREVW